MRASSIVLLLVGLAAGCPHYDYEEDVLLHADGSGEISIHGSQELLVASFGLDGVVDPGTLSVEELTSLLDSETLHVTSTRRTEGNSCTFLHIRARFGDLNRLNQHPAFADRRYRLLRTEELLYLEADLRPAPVARETYHPCGNGKMSFRFRFPSTVRKHNSPTGLERGNILRWEQAVAARAPGEPLHIEVQFERRTVLAMTLRLLAVSVGLIIFLIGLSLYLLVRKGRKELAREIDGKTPRRPG